MASRGLTLLSQWLIRGVARVQCSEGTLKSSFTGLGYCFHSSARPFACKVIFLYHTLPFSQLCKWLCTSHASSSSTAIPAQGASVTPSSVFLVAAVGVVSVPAQTPALEKRPFCTASWSVRPTVVCRVRCNRLDVICKGKCRDEGGLENAGERTASLDSYTD